jgi:hypothetical protein
MKKLLIYSAKDYEGELNYLRHERRWILEAALFSQGDRERLSKLLKITSRTLYNKIKQHRLDSLMVEMDNTEIQKVMCKGVQEFRAVLAGLVIIAQDARSVTLAEFVSLVVKESLSQDY